MTEGVAGSSFVRFVLGCVSARNVSSLLYCFRKGFVVTAICKAVYKFISTSYVTVLVRANAAKAKCKAYTKPKGDPSKSLSIILPDVLFLVQI